MTTPYEECCRNCLYYKKLSTHEVMPGVRGEVGRCTRPRIGTSQPQTTLPHSWCDQWTTKREAPKSAGEFSSWGTRNPCPKCGKAQILFAKLESGQIACSCQTCGFTAHPANTVILAMEYWEKEIRELKEQEKLQEGQTLYVDNSEEQLELDIPVEDDNILSPACEERLYLLIEECGEVIQAATKVLRHGYESHHPMAPETSNRDNLKREVRDLLAVIEMMSRRADIHVRRDEGLSDIIAQKLRYTYFQHKDLFND